MLEEKAQLHTNLTPLNFENLEPDILATATGHGEEKQECKQEILSHLSCYQFYQDEHVH
jgi:hypothetical protein